MSFDDTFEKQLVETYDKSARHFAQLFNATIIFAVAFLAFILVPLVALQHEDARIGTDLQTAMEQTAKAEAEETAAIEAQEKARTRLAELTKQRTDLEQQLTNQEAELAAAIEPIQQSLDELTQERGLLEEQLKPFTQVRQAAENLRPLDVDAFVRELQDFLGEASDVIWGEAPLTSLDFPVDCPHSSADKRANCVIRAKVMQMLSMTEQNLRDQIIAPLAKIDPATASELEERLKQAHGNFGRVLDEQPQFWQAVVQKRDVGQEFAAEIARLSEDISAKLRAKIDQFINQASELKEKEAELLNVGRAQQDKLNQLQVAKEQAENEAKRISDQIKDAEAQISATSIDQLKAKVLESKKQVTDLTEKQNKITKDKDAISDRLKNVQSPFGALPIGLTEAVQVFPIIVVVGLSMALFALTAAIRVRSRYHRLLGTRYPDKVKETDERVLLTAPLFLDPRRKPRDNFWRGAILALPLVIYAISIVLIMESQRQVPQTLATSRTIEHGYLWVYFILLVAVAAPLYAIFDAWKTYETPDPGQPPRTDQTSVGPNGLPVTGTQPAGQPGRSG